MKQINETTFTSDNGLITFIHGDCMEFMAGCREKEFDLAVVDPPYGININPNMGLRKGKKKRHKNIKWDERVPDDEYFKLLFKSSLNQIIWGGDYFNLPPTKHFIFWDKLNAEGLSFSDGEMAWTSFNRAIRKWSRRNSIAGKIHPTQKPIELYRWIFKNYAKAGDTILDTHGGSMSSAIAAHMEGLKMTIIELDKEYFDSAIQRFSTYEQQQTINFE